MANQDILHELWIKNHQPCTSVTIDQIASYAKENCNNFHSRNGKKVSVTGIDYAILKFILEYCTPKNWPTSRWDEFIRAKNPHKGNYALWRKYLVLTVDINDKKIEVGNEKDAIETISDTSRSKRSEIDVDFIFQNEDMHQFVNFIVTTIEQGKYSESGGWQAIMQSYQWPLGKGDFNGGIEIRRNFNFLVNQALFAMGRGALTFKRGICNAIAGWAGIPQEVSEADVNGIFSTIEYLSKASI